MSLPPQLPPLDGSLTIIPGFIDFHAQYNADRKWAVYPVNTPAEVAHISFAEFAKATHRVAHHLRPCRRGDERQTIGILVECDTILYVALIAGMIRAGIIPFPISTRNSPQAIAHLLKSTKACCIITQDVFAPVIRVVQDQLAEENVTLVQIMLPALQDVFPDLNRDTDTSTAPVEPYSDPGSTPTLDDVMLYIHSSGSTGLPKPIPQTYRTQIQWANSTMLLESRKRGVQWAVMTLPTIHMMGIFMQLLNPLVCGQPMALYPPQAPLPPVAPNTDNALEVCRITRSSAMACVPAFIEVWTQSPETVDYLATLQSLSFGGGPLSPTSGHKLVNAGVQLFSMYGSSECGSVSRGFDTDDSQGPNAPWKTSADWEWLQINPNMKPRFVPRGDGTYELHMLTCDTHQPAIENLSDVKGFSTSDIFEPHPSKKGLWRVVGRTDDVIVLATGEKVVPIPQEGHIISYPMISGAIMFGRGRNQAGVLIEPYSAHAVDTDNESAVAEFRNKVWPVIEAANKLAPSFGRIFKEMIIVTSPRKPLPRAAKSTIIRKQALQLYNAAIEALYQAVDDSANADGITPPASWYKDDIESWLLQHIAALTDGRSICASVDLFSQGFDSLTATFARNRIIGALRMSSERPAQAAANQISQNFIFDHPSIQELASAIEHLVYGTTPDLQNSPVDMTQALIEEYSADLPLIKRNVSPGDNTVVLLTGSTGNLGSHILVSLLTDNRISKVYTLDRASSNTSVQRRQELAFKDRNLPIELLSSTKLRVLTGDFNLANFGVEVETINEIRDSVTHFIHNAWKVDFNLSLASFGGQIAGTRKLIDFCAAMPHPAKILFTSSISVASGWSSTNGPVPEEPLPEAKVATASGYSASKYVVEQILARAWARGLNATALRVGQVCGSSSSGAWNITDWVPILVKSSVALGYFPSRNDAVDWIPMDVVAGTVCDLVLSKEPLPQLLNVVHPRPVQWDDIFKFVTDELAPDTPLVSYAAWFEKLSAVAADASVEQVRDVPAIKLIEFFRLLAVSSSEISGNISFATSKLEGLSITIKQLDSIGNMHARSWVGYWRGRGLFA